MKRNNTGRDGGARRSQKRERSGFTPRHGTLPRRSRISVRVLALLGVVSFGFMLVFVATDAAGRSGTGQTLEAAGSKEARLGADQPGEVVHITAAVAALAIGASGLLGLAIKPERTGSAFHTGAVAAAMVATVLIVGNPDNTGGQAGTVDPAFLVMALPPIAATLTARPWRSLRSGQPMSWRFAALTAMGIPGLWYGLQNALMQRNTWPPMADPHHQAHWYATALLGFLAVLVVAGAAMKGRGWQLAAVMGGLGAVSLGVVSLIGSTAASALGAPWAIYAIVWGATALTLTHYDGRDKDAYERLRT